MLLCPLSPCSRADEPTSNLLDSILSSEGNNANTSPSPYYTVVLDAPINDLRAVWLWSRDEAVWADELSSVYVFLSTSPTPGYGREVLCSASNVSATGANQLVKVSCEGAAAGSSWQYVRVQRFTYGAGMSFGLAELRVMRGGEA